jgi:hypothetical protein
MSFRKGVWSLPKNRVVTVKERVVYISKYTHCSFTSYTAILAFNSNAELLTCIVAPCAGVGDTKVGGEEQLPLALTVMTNCKGTLLSAEAEEESTKSSICIAIP